MQGDPNLAALLDEIAASGLATDEAVKGLKNNAADDDPEASASDEQGSPGASMSDETAPGEGLPEDSDEALKNAAELLAVDADELLKAIDEVVERRVAIILAPAMESLKSLTAAAAAQIGLARNGLEIGLKNAETLKGLAPAVESLKSLASTPVATPARPGAAVSSRLPPPRDVPTPGGDLTTAEVNKAINLSLIHPSVGQAALTAIENSKPLPGEIDVAGLREKLAAAAK